MNTKLSAVSGKRMDLTCSACGHKFSYKVDDLVLATSDDPPPMKYVRKPYAGAVEHNRYTETFESLCDAQVWRDLMKVLRAKIKHL